MTYGSIHDAAYFARQDKSHELDLAHERMQFKAEQILDGFDWKDVRDSLELAVEKDPEAFQALCESLAHLQHIPIHKIEDRRIRDLAIALDKVSRFYAGHRAAGEAA